MRTTPLAFAAGLLAFAVPAFAGPPFLCHPFDIGGATSLPWSSGDDWTTGNSSYDITKVVADAEAILAPSTPIPLRMETLRRASLYASRDRVVAQSLLDTLLGRVNVAERAGHTDGLAHFDAGYVIEAFEEIAALAAYETRFVPQARELSAVTRPHDPQSFLVKSQALRPNDGAVDMALALLMRNSPEKDAHLRRARDGATRDSLLAANLVKLQLQ